MTGEYVEVDTRRRRDAPKVKIPDGNGAPVRSHPHPLSPTREVPMSYFDDWSYEDRTITPVFPPFAAFLGQRKLRRYDLVAQLARAFRLPAGTERDLVVETFLLEVHLRAADRYSEGDLRLAGPVVRGSREVVEDAVALRDRYEMLALLDAVKAGGRRVAGRIDELEVPMREVFVEHFHPRAEAVLRKALRRTRRLDQAA